MPYLAAAKLQHKKQELQKLHVIRMLQQLQKLMYTKVNLMKIKASYTI